jgi:hypothetical protein
MRKQYHSRPTSRGRLIWDVDHLVALSAGLPRIRVALTDIRELDEPFWFGGPDDVATCRAVADHASLIQATDLSYPIILSSDGRVMDGMHRVAKAHMLGLAEIEAVRFERDPEPDYVDVPDDQLPYEESNDGV